MAIELSKGHRLPFREYKVQERDFWFTSNSDTDGWWYNKPKRNVLMDFNSD